MTEASNPKSKSYRYIPVLLFLVAGLPVIVAVIMYFTDTMVPKGRTNKGTLITPPLAVDMLGLKLQQSGEGSVEGKWELIVIGLSGGHFSCAFHFRFETNSDSKPIP